MYKTRSIGVSFQTETFLFFFLFWNIFKENIHIGVISKQFPSNGCLQTLKTIPIVRIFNETDVKWEECRPKAGKYVVFGIRDVFFSLASLRLGDSNWILKASLQYSNLDAQKM